MASSYPHTIAYSIIAVQELNLAYFYPPIYWNTACLIVDSDGLQNDDDDEENFEGTQEEGGEEDSGEDNDEDDDEESPKKEKIKKKPKVVQYGKISTAIGRMKQNGIEVSPPDINESSYTFVPNEKENRIIYGIKGISKINDELANKIISARPFTSLEDFNTRVGLTKVQTINLIKSGAFDRLEERPRKAVMREYIRSIAGCKKKLTLQNMPSLIRLGVFSEEHELTVRIFNFNKWLKKNKKDIYYILDDESQKFYCSFFDEDLLELNEYGMCIKAKDWDKIYKKEMDKIRPTLADSATLDKLNEKLIGEIWNKYCLGGIPKWEMDSIGFYNGAHELSSVRDATYGVQNYFDLPDEPIIEKTFMTKDGKEIPIYKLTRIMGTVIEKNKLKNMITLLTKEGVVKIKIYKPQFVKYDRQISERDEETGKKMIVERSWFTRGNKLILCGIRRNSSFVPKTYRNTEYNAISLIKKINDDGTMEIIEDRQCM